jgi:hypothetical protein
MTDKLDVDGYAYQLFTGSYAGLTNVERLELATWLNRKARKEETKNPGLYWVMKKHYWLGVMQTLGWVE